MARRSPRIPAEHRREEILDAAEACFALRGYHETKVDDIAERAGLSKGAVYWHFEGKRDLFLALLDRYLDALREWLREAPQDGDAPAALRSISHVILRSVPHTMPIFELTLEYMAHAARDEELQVRLRRIYGLLSEAISPPIERGVREGRFRRLDVDGAVLTVIATMDGLLAQKVLRPDLDLDRVWHQAEAILIRGLEAK